MKIILTNGWWWRIFQLCGFPVGTYVYLKLTEPAIRIEYVWWIFIGAMFLGWMAMCVRIVRTKNEVK